MLPIVVFFGGCNCGTTETEDGLNSYTVLFYTDSNDPGSINRESQTVKHGHKVERPKDPTKDGYTFVYWCKDSACEIPWDFNKDVVEEPLILYAKWSHI